MAGSKSNYLETLSANRWLGKTAATISSTVPGTLYARLIESTVTIDDTWTPLSTGECQGSTYLNRVQNKAVITNSSTSWTNSTAGGSKTNTVTITITTAAGSDWGSVGQVALCDSYTTSSGNMWFWADLTGGTAVIASGNTVQFATGAIVYTED